MSQMVKVLQTQKEPVYLSQIKNIPLENLGSGDVVIESHFSSLNYKDALAVTGKGRILKKFPLVPGIDVSGTVSDPGSSELKIGQNVLVTGCGLGETSDGGYGTYVKVPKEWIVVLPEGLSTKEAMTLGTAGFTAALSLYRMEQMGQSPDKGPIAISGASGGVGLLGVQIFSQAGYEVTAISGKTDKHDLLKKFGANSVFTPQELSLGTRPLEATKFAGALDNVGGDMLAGLQRHIGLWGNIACVGLAQSHELNTTVMPMILRGVSLLGISSANCPLPLRKTLWANLAGPWKPGYLEETITNIIRLEDLGKASQKMLSQKTFGRTLVSLG